MTRSPKVGRVRQPARHGLKADEATILSWSKELRQVSLENKGKIFRI
jgi:hypothetical protein